MQFESGSATQFPTGLTITLKELLTVRRRPVKQPVVLH